MILKVLYPYCAQDTIRKSTVRWDITLLYHALLQLTYFSTFYRCSYGPTLVENSNFFVYL